MKKPTRAQMEKRPSLWIDEDDGYMIICYPDGKNDYMWDYEHE